MRQLLFAVLLLSIGFQYQNVRAQGASPGPYEILPFEDAYIVEAFVDLASTQIADWTGWTAGVWESPNAYNGHGGTDFSMSTGTPVYAPVAGTVIARETSILENAGTGYGNFVKIAATGLSPRGEQLDILTAHLLPTVQVTVGQPVTAGQLIGYSDNTGNSTSEHCHVESSLRSGGTITCPFYHGQYKYPIMLNPTARKQIGHVVRVSALQTAIRSDRFDSSPIVGTAHQDQLYFASFPKRGYYRIFIPNDPANRSAWIKAIDVQEVYTGTVIQALPDSGLYVHTTQLISPYIIRAAANDLAAEIGRIRWGGGRFVADQQQAGGWYRVPLPGASATWGWVKADSSMVVYPQLTNPSINPASAPNLSLPQTNAFSVAGPTNWGRPKFDRGVVQAFSPSSPGGDGLAYFLTDAVNAGDGIHDTISVGRPEHRDYFVQAHVYCNYNPPYGTYERVGVFLRDDCFGGLDQTFEGKGNCYAFLWDTDDGRLRACKIVDAVITDFFPSPQFITGTAWRKMRIEAENDTIRFYLNDVLQLQVNDTTFPSGPCGIAYSKHISGFPAGRGVYFDNFSANLLTTSAVSDWTLFD